MAWRVRSYYSVSLCLSTLPFGEPRQDLTSAVVSVSSNSSVQPKRNTEVFSYSLGDESDLITRPHSFRNFSVDVYGALQSASLEFVTLPREFQLNLRAYAMTRSET